MNTDQSILNANQQEVKEYLNNLAEAVCINGEALEKYEKVVTKQYGEETYNNMKMFVEEVQGYVKRKSFTNTSKVNLGYLGKNARLSDGAIENIIMHFERKFSNQRKNPKWVFPLIALIVVALGGVFYLCAPNKYATLEEAIEGANKPYIRQIWDRHQIGTISLDKTHELVEFEYMISEDRGDWTLDYIREKGQSQVSMILIANFMFSYEKDKDKNDSEIGGEHNPPLYRAINVVLYEARQVGLGIGFNIKDKNGEGIIKINCDCTDLNTAMTNWKELH